MCQNVLEGGEAIAAPASENGDYAGGDPVYDENGNVIGETEGTMRSVTVLVNGYWSWTGGQQNPQKYVPYTTDQTQRLRNDLAEYLKRKNCGIFFERVINETATVANVPFFPPGSPGDPSDHYFLRIFDAIAKTGGKGGLYTAVNGTPGLSSGSVGGGNARMELTFNPESRVFGWFRAQDVAHEIAHLASKSGNSYTEWEVAQASYDVASRMGYQVPSPPSTKDDAANSAYFGDRIQDVSGR